MSLIVKALDMNVLAMILGKFVDTGFIILIIVFQQEVRRFLFYLGRTSGIGKDNFWERLFSRSVSSPSEINLMRDEIVRAVKNMMASRTGALIVFTDSAEQKFFSDTGVPINGDISSKLLESIFDKTSPLHDGAVVVSEGKILAAGCVLPVSENPEVPSRVGMRHRAAIGITEQIDAHVLVVSEERGKVSLAYNGHLNMNLTPLQLEQELGKILSN